MSMRATLLNVVRVLFICLFFVTFILSIIYFESITHHVHGFVYWLQGLDFLFGALLLGASNMVGAILALPCLLFTLAAGFLYVITVASTLASVVAFLIARYLARNLVERVLGNKEGGSRLRAMDQSIKTDGFKVVFLIRLSPLHPYGICNYLFGVTSVSLSDYTLATFFGMMPSTIMEVYFGSAMKNVADIVQGNITETPASRIFFYGGLVVTLIVTLYVSFWVKWKLDLQLTGYEHVELDEVTDENDTSDAYDMSTPTHSTLSNQGGTHTPPSRDHSPHQHNNPTQSQSNDKSIPGSGGGSGSKQSPTSLPTSFAGSYGSNIGMSMGGGGSGGGGGGSGYTSSPQNAPAQYLPHIPHPPTPQSVPSTPPIRPNQTNTNVGQAIIVPLRNIIAPKQSRD